MRHIGRLPFVGDVFIVEVHLGWTVAIYLLVQVPILGDALLNLIRELQ